MKSHILIYSNKQKAIMKDYEVYCTKPRKVFSSSILTFDTFKSIKKLKTTTVLTYYTDIIVDNTSKSNKTQSRILMIVTILLTLTTSRIGTPKDR